MSEILHVGILPCLHKRRLLPQPPPREQCDAHENTRQIELHLETDVYVCPVNGRTPPQSEPTVRDLVQTGPLSVCQLLVPHGLLEPRRFLPEETLPCWEVSSFEQCVLEDTFDTTKGRDYVDTVVVQLPQLAVMALRCPPEGIAINPSDRLSMQRCITHCLSNWYCFQSVRTRQPRSYASLHTISVSYNGYRMRGRTCADPSGTAY